MCGILVTAGVNAPFHHRQLRSLRKRGPDEIGFWSGATVCASSLLKNILEIVKESRDLDYTAISEYVRYQFTFGDKTFIKQIKKVMPGHIVEIDLNSGEKKITCYEDIFAPSTRGLQ